MTDPLQGRALEGRAALVTGSSRGIGAAILRELAAQGARVVIHCNRQLESARALQAEIEQARGEATILQADLSSADQAADLVRRAADACGGLDILVNNAGIIAGKTLDTLTAEQIDRVLAVNLRAVLLASREFARLRVPARPGGRIVNISSVAARVPSGGSSLYAASKAAVESLSRSHATELGPAGITVNAVAPGTTETDMVEQTFPKAMRDAVVRGTALGRLGQPADIARVVAFLCGDAAGWITGQAIGVDGGMVTGAFNLARAAGVSN
jgi:3-oxoacyl-[acyl-carrier protein] reductase